MASSTLILFAFGLSGSLEGKKNVPLGPSSSGAKCFF